MNIVNEKEEKNKRYLPHELKTRENAVKTYRNGNSINYVCRKYHISRTSLYRWNKAYDGTRESLLDKSHKPLSKHPNAHTDTELKWINDLVRRHKNDNLTLCEIWYKLRINKGYSRHIGSLYRVMRKLGYYKQININGTSKYIPKRYNTPSMIGEKWQIDVKFVPKECKRNDLPEDKKFYQYTCIDEASRERFLYWYDEHTPANTVDFVKRCLAYYEYKQEEIQNEKYEREYQHWSCKYLNDSFNATINFYDDTNVTFDNYNNFISIFNSRISEIKDMYVSCYLSYTIQHGNDSKSVANKIYLHIYENKMSKLIYLFLFFAIIISININAINIGTIYFSIRW